MLSKVKKEILLKTVAHAIPNYLISMFLLPKRISDGIEKAINRYWWRSSMDCDSGIHWPKWGRLACSKEAGGLGFRIVRDFKITMLAKQGWKFMNQP